MLQAVHSLVSEHTHTHTHIHTYIHTYNPPGTGGSPLTRIGAHTHTHTYIHTYNPPGTGGSPLTRIGVYIYTHIHTYIQPSRYWRHSTHSYRSIHTYIHTTIQVLEAVYSLVSASLIHIDRTSPQQLVKACI
jgi:hypothetical protein